MRGLPSCESRTPTNVCVSLHCTLSRLTQRHRQRFCVFPTPAATRKKGSLVGLRETVAQGEVPTSCARAVAKVCCSLQDRALRQMHIVALACVCVWRHPGCTAPLVQGTAKGGTNDGRAGSVSVWLWRRRADPATGVRCASRTMRRQRMRCGDPAARETGTSASDSTETQEPTGVGWLRRQRENPRRKRTLTGAAEGAGETSTQHKTCVHLQRGSARLPPDRKAVAVAPPRSSYGNIPRAE